jgi:hypothetical protein
MEIILFEKRYRIDVENIVLILEDQLLINLKNTPGVEQSEIENYQNDIRGHFKNVIDNLLGYYQNPDSIISVHTDKFANVESTLRVQYSDFTEEKEKKMKEYQPTQYKKEVVRFIDSFAIEFHTIFFPEYKIKENSLPDKFEDDTNLTHTKGIKEFLDKFIPDYIREYRSPFFDFLNDHIKVESLVKSTFSIKVIKFDKSQFDSKIDDIFVNDSIITIDQKNQLKSWFHYSKNDKVRVEPMYFDDDDDAPYYIAYFIRECGGCNNSEVQYIESIFKINQWLQCNLLLNTTGNFVIKFDQLNRAFKKKSRKKVKDNILKKIQTWK